MSVATLKRSLVFGGGLFGGGYKATANTLATNDVVEVLLGISEGPIQGPVNGAQSFYLDNTPLVAPNGEPNFSAFSLDFWPGSPTGDTVAMLTGGFGSPTQVGQQLYYSAPVSRQGTQTQINAVDFDVTITNLVYSDNHGEHTCDLQLLFEYAGPDGVWHPCFTDTTGTSGANQTGGTSLIDILKSQLAQNIASFGGDRGVLTYADGMAAPTADQLNAVAIDNAGNVYHWDVGSTAWVQAVMQRSGDATWAYWNDIEGTKTIKRKVFWTTSTPDDAAQGDIWIKGGPASSNYLIYNGAAWVVPEAYINYQPTVEQLNNGIWHIKAKVTSATSVTFRCFLPASDQPYSFRVTKQSPDDDGKNFTDCSWEAFTEVKQQAWTFDSLSMLRCVGMASDQFTAIPSWLTDCEGRIVKVPSNYDPVARTYTGVWDGTYKLAYTNNPAWVFKDFVENTTYGLSSVYPTTCNPWSIYEWAQWCDVMVPKADGTLQPRYTYNVYLTQQKDAKETAQYIAGAAGALMVDDGAGMVDVFYDDPSAPAVALFTPESVSPDGFAYSYTDRMTRANQIQVSFPNPAVNWATDLRMEENTDDIATYGTITDQIIAVGCIDPDEALRRARYRLTSGLTETEFVTFTTNRKGKYLRPWNIMLVADPTLGRGLTGRINSQIDAQTVKLRDPITLEPGFSYTAHFEAPNPNYGTNNDDEPLMTVSLPITTAAGTVTQLAFSGALPANLPPYATFAIECANTVGTPTPYRITNIRDTRGDGESITITGLLVNRNKQAFIDGATTQIITGTGTTLDTKTVNPPTNLKVSNRIQQIGLVSSQILTLTWDPSTSPLVSTYTVYIQEDGQPTRTITVGKNQCYVDIPAVIGEYVFEVEAVNLAGTASSPATLVYDCTGQTRSVAGPTNLELMGGTGPTTFNTNDATFAWTPSSPLDPLFDHYQVSIIDTTSQQVVRTMSVGSVTSWVYTYAMNKADGLRRTFQVSVEAVDTLGNLSAPTVLTVTNPAPTAPLNIEFIPSESSVVMLFTPPDDPDYAGVNVWSSSTQGGTETLAWSTSGHPTIQGSAGTDVWLSWQFFDSFGTVGCPISTPVKVSFSPVDQVIQQLTDLDNAFTQAADKQQQTVDQFINQLASQVADVQKAVAAAEANANAIMTSVLSAYQQAAAAKAATYVNGAPAGQLIQNLTTQADGFTENFSLMGQKSADGTAWIMNDSTVQLQSNGTSLAQTVTSINTNIGNNTSSITNLQTSQSSQNSTFSSQISTLQSNVAANSSQITANYTTAANSNSSLASSYTSLKSTVDGNTAQITANYSTATNSNSALAASITSLQSTVSNNSAQITANYSTAANSNSALASSITNLQSTVNNNNTNLQSQITANFSTAATSNAAIADAVNGVSASLNGRTTQVSTNASSIATVTGQLYSTYTLKANSNGNIASITLMTSSGGQVTSGIIFEANQLQIRSATASKIAPFYYDATSGTLFLNSVTVNSANIGTAQVQTLHVANANITNHATADAGVNANLGNSDPGSDLVDVNLTTSGTGPVLLHFRVDCTTTGSGILIVRPTQDGVLGDTYTFYLPSGYAASQFSFCAFIKYATPSAATHSYGVRAYTATVGQTVTAKTAAVDAIEFKK